MGPCTVLHEDVTLPRGYERQQRQGYEKERLASDNADRRAISHPSRVSKCSRDTKTGSMTHVNFTISKRYIIRSQLVALLRRHFGDDYSIEVDRFQPATYRIAVLVNTNKGKRRQAECWGTKNAH